MTDIDQLSGLALRKALCEALGWKLFHYESGMYATSPEDIADAWNNDGYTLEGWSESKEAWQCQLESDPGVFWPEFERWGNTQCVSAEIETGGSVHVVVLTAHNPENDDEKIIGTGRGVTLLEAGCRAWLKTLKEAQ